MKLSIITINLNNATGLLKTIESVVSQSYTDYEFIIIDGGSTDGSVEIIEEFVDEITYWISEQDNGIYNAMNKGIQHAKGEYLQFLNSGDYLYDSSILEQVFNATEVSDVIYTDGYHQQNNSDPSRFTLPDKLSLLYLIDYSISHPGTFILKKIFDELGYYNENNKIISDREFFIKALLKDYKFSKIDISAVVMEQGGISQSNGKLLKKEIENTVLATTNENYYQLYLDRMNLMEQLSFLKRSKILEFILNHKGNYFIKRIIRLL